MGAPKYLDLDAAHSILELRVGVELLGEVHTLASVSQTEQGSE